MPNLSVAVDALLIDEIFFDSDPGGSIVNWTGTLTIAGAGALTDTPTCTGVMRKVGGKIIGSLRIGVSAMYIPITLNYTSDTTLVGGNFTFILPATEFSTAPNNIAVDGFFFAQTVTATDAGGTFSAVTINLVGNDFIPGSTAATATLVMVPVVVPFVVPAFDEAGDAMDFTATAVVPLEEVRVNRELNPFDNLGLLLGIDRLRAERNYQLADRVGEAFVRRGSSTNVGLLNAITRDLSLERLDVVEIKTTRTFAGNDREVKVVVDDSWLRLYDRYINDDNFNLDFEVDLRAVNVKYLSELIGVVNAGTSNFEMRSLVTDHASRFSRTLMFQDSWKQVRREVVPVATGFSLDNTLIKEGAIFFSDKVAFLSEVFLLADLNVAGDFFIDYENGLVRTITLPRMDSTATYVYATMPFRLHASDVVVGDINGEGLRRHYFTQEPQTLYTKAEDAEIDGLPTDEMFEVVKELLEAADVYWAA